jgi:hypothetical protein
VTTLPSGGFRIVTRPPTEAAKKKGPAQRPTKLAAIALANKLARMAWAMMAKGEHYKEPAALTA